MKRPTLAASFSLCPGAALAHDAFGDIGPLYSGLLHPLADPAQGLVLVSLAVLLARQPIENVRPAYALLLAFAAMLLALHAATELPNVGAKWSGLVAIVLGLLALSGLRLPLLFLFAIVAIAATMATWAIDQPDGARSRMLAMIGAFLGIASTTLLAWGAIDFAQQKLGPIASAVVSSWIVAIGVMWLAFALQG